ncbi:MAG: winged helix-turn-helix domain-containing protein [Chloroflexota bacterium]
MLDALIVVGAEARDRVELTLRLAWPDATLRYRAPGRQVIDQLRDTPPDLVILDLGLPGEAGLEALTAARRLPSVAVVGIAGRREDDQGWRQAIELGVDDYLVAPYPPMELLARAGAALRQRESSVGRVQPAGPWGDGYLSFDLRERKTCAGGQPACLTRTEYNFLERLARQPDAIVTTRALLTGLWGAEGQDRPEFPGAYARRIRERIEPDPAVPRYLLTERGIGYRLALARPRSTGNGQTD